MLFDLVPLADFRCVLSTMFRDEPVWGVLGPDLSEDAGENQQHEQLFVFKRFRHISATQLRPSPRRWARSLCWWGAAPPSWSRLGDVPYWCFHVLQGSFGLVLDFRSKAQSGHKHTLGAPKVCLRPDSASDRSSRTSSDDPPAELSHGLKVSDRRRNTPKSVQNPSESLCAGLWVPCRVFWVGFGPALGRNPV